jgi:hypothetical protein
MRQPGDSSLLCAATSAHGTGRCRVAPAGVANLSLQLSPLHSADPACILCCCVTRGLIFCIQQGSKSCGRATHDSRVTLQTASLARSTELSVNNAMKLPRYALSSVCALLLLFCRCSLAGPAYRPKSPLNVAVWTNANAEWFTYPEQSNSSNYFMPDIDQRPNIGIAVSGGG